MSVVTAGTKLVCCDECGVVAVKGSKGWRCWKEAPSFTPMTPHFMAERHHCPSCADNNQLLATGLVYGCDPATAVVYEPV